MSYITFHDISYAQGSYDMAADPNPIVFMKMSGFYYGNKSGYYDTQANRNYQNAKAAGKITGLYHFAGGADPVAEADYFIGACSPLEQGDILILDYELTDAMNPPADPSAWCLAFVERVKERTGKYPLFYTYFAMLQAHGFAEVLKRCGLWIAHYGVSPDQDIPSCPPYILHQFQGSPLDTNACFVSLDVLKQYGYETPAPAVATPVETPAPAPVSAPEPAPAPETKTPQMPSATPPEPGTSPKPKVIVPDQPHLHYSLKKLFIALVKKLLGLR